MRREWDIADKTKPSLGGRNTMNKTNSALGDSAWRKTQSQNYNRPFCRMMWQPIQESPRHSVSTSRNAQLRRKLPEEGSTELSFEG